MPSFVASKHESLANYLLVYLLLFVSGSWIYQLSPNKLLLLIFAVSFLVWVFYSDRKIRNSFVLYVIFFTSFLLIISLYTDGSLLLTSIIGSVIQLLLAYFIVKKVGAAFTATYIKVVVFLALFSLLGYMSDTFYLFDVVIRKLPRVGEVGYEGLFYLFRFAGHIERNNSIFFEPGAYQIFLNAALFMILFSDTGFSTTRRWVYVLILTITLLTTFSTTGYLIFAIMFGLFLFGTEEISKTSKALMVGILVIIVVIFSSQFHEVIFKKFESFTSIQHITDQNDRRSLDLLVDLEILKTYLMGVGHKQYIELFSKISHIRPEYAGSSNGITKTLAIYGVPFSVFLFSSYLWALRRLLGVGVVSFAAYIMLMMFFVGESYYVLSPFCVALIAAAFIYDSAPKSKNPHDEYSVPRD